MGQICKLPTESIRFELTFTLNSIIVIHPINFYLSRVGDWKIIRGCPGLLTDWYNLTNFDPSNSKTDAGIELALKNDPSLNCLDSSKPTNSTYFYFLFNIKGNFIAFFLKAETHKIK
jgi:hypothetical protein